MRLSAPELSGRWLAAVLAIHAVVSALVLPFGTVLQDEGLLYVWGSRLLDGQLPYTDFYTFQAPGTFYVTAVLIKLFGVSLIAGRVWKQLEMLLVIWMAFVLVRRASHSRRAGLVAAIAASIFSAAHHIRYPWYGTDACLCLLIAAWLSCVAIDTGRIRWLVVSGVALGAVMLFKQNQGVFGTAAVGLIVCHHGWFGSEGTIGKRLSVTVASGSALAVGYAGVLTAYLTYYVSAGGSLELLRLNTFTWAAESKDYPSLLTMLTNPLVSFTLTSRGDWRFPACALGVIGGSALAMSGRLPLWARVLGGAVLLACAAQGPDYFVRAFIWSFVSFLILLTAVLAFWESRSLRSTAGPGPELERSHKLLLVAMLAVLNLYGGTIPGGGWGRLVETLTGSLVAFGVLAALLEHQGGLVARHWERLVGTSPGHVGLAFGLVALTLSAGMLIKNQAARPKLDVELTAMQGRATLPGWRGVRGDATYVAETEELLKELRGRSDAERMSLYVFPLNAAILPLAGAKNPTRYDSHQSDFLAPSQFNNLIGELERTRPRLVVMQPIDNPSSGVENGGLVFWVRPALRAAVERFVHSNYQRARLWHYYELWQRR